MLTISHVPIKVTEVRHELSLHEGAIIDDLKLVGDEWVLIVRSNEENPKKTHMVRRFDAGQPGPTMAFPYIATIDVDGVLGSFYDAGER